MHVLISLLQFSFVDICIDVPVLFNKYLLAQIPGFPERAVRAAAFFLFKDKRTLLRGELVEFLNGSVKNAATGLEVLRVHKTFDFLSFTDHPQVMAVYTEFDCFNSSLHWS